MARRLRVQFPGAMYHVINRGNYRRDVFESVGAAKAFEVTLDETCARFGWRLQGYVIMRNHFHLALETPEPNLVEGMHWLQSTFATRFNRLRSERGHLFQGRYQALLIEDASALARVVNYIHLNPARAKVVLPSQVAMFRWSSLTRFLKRERPVWLIATVWLEQLGWSDSKPGWAGYVGSLVDIAESPQRQHEAGLVELSRGWAIGTSGWRRAIAKDHAHLRLDGGLKLEEIRAWKEARWEEELLEAALLRAGKSKEDVQRDGKASVWKLAIAAELRSKAGAPHRWIVRRLCMGSHNSLRAYLNQNSRLGTEQISAGPVLCRSVALRARRLQASSLPRCAAARSARSPVFAQSRATASLME